VSEPQVPELDFWDIGDRGLTLLQLAKYDEALELFERCLSIFPWEGKTIFNKAVCLYELGRYREALECYEHLIPHESEDGGALINSAYCHLKLGDDLLAESVAQRATEIHPNDHFAWVTLGWIRHHQSKIRDALEAYGRAEKLRPDDPTIHYNTALANNRLGELAAAARSFKHFLMISSPLDKRRTIASDEIEKIEKALRTERRQ
jgi:tetratricopeptide (TPR) repeat protein